MKKFLTICLLIIIPSVLQSQQLYQGPSTGTVSHGVIVSTNNFMSMANGNGLPQYLKKPTRNKIRFIPYPDKLNTVMPTASEGSNYISDPLISQQQLNPNVDPFTIKSFQGLLDPGNFIPPDFYLAVGPTHIVGVDNGRFRIWDKNGGVVKTINGDSWFSSVLPGAGAFDPKVSYDHFAKRWVMVWLDQSDELQRGTILISVSDDSIPTGTWYNWALPSNANGSIPANSWGDYQGVGFDDQAFYITTNQFQFGGYFEGTKIRIIKKSELYANNAGALSFTDLWDLREPSNPNLRTFGTRPVIYFTPYTDGYYLVCVPPYYPQNTSMVVYKITNPITNPVLTGTDVPMTAYSSPPGASQLGGGPSIESGGDDLRNEPVFRNGFIWGVHQIRNAVYTAYSSLRYFKINTQTNTTVEDIAMGANGYWHYYCSICVDKDLNTAITYSRSGDSSYIGAFYTSRINNDPPNYLSGSRLIQSGKAHYSKDFGGGRNRWGDYNGIWLDPSDQNNFWMLTEYAESPANTWAGWVSNVRLIPFSGAKINNSKDTLKFGSIESGFSSDTVKVTISNLGSDTLLINRIDIINTQFKLYGSASFPIKIGFGQSKDLFFKFYPTAYNNITDSIIIVNNDATNPNKKIIVKAIGYVINTAKSDSIYGISGSLANGSFVSINKLTGSASLIGLSGFGDIKSISIRPSDRNIYGCMPGTGMSQLVRINSLNGDAYLAKDVPLNDIRTIAFDKNDTMYAATANGLLYRYNIATNDTHFVGNTNIFNFYGIAINPINGQLWGVSLLNKIYKIDKSTGVAIQVGIPGFTITPSIAFNSKGELYGLSGLGTQISHLIKYDTATGTATLIGTTSYQGLNALVIAPVGPPPSNIPVTYNLYQNYPNPFNAGTTIEFDIPNTTNLSLIIYDVSGRKITTLINSTYSPGSYKYKWESPNLASGIYFYELKGAGISFVRKLAIIK